MLTCLINFTPHETSEQQSRNSGTVTRSKKINFERKKQEMELFEDVNELKELMDKVLLQTMELLEEDVTLKINIEKLTNEGALMIAKTR